MTRFGLFIMGVLLLAAGVLSPCGWSKQIHTKDGRVYEGRIIAEDVNSVTVELKYGPVVIPRDRIEQIQDEPQPSPTSTQKPTPRPTNTRPPTSTPTETQTPVPEDTPTPTSTTPPVIQDSTSGQPVQSPAKAAVEIRPVTAQTQVVYPLPEAEELISKYEKTKVPKAKYVLAYYAKGVHSLADNKVAAAIKYWTDALQVNEQIYSRSLETDGKKSVLEAGFESGLALLETEARRNPAAAVTQTISVQRALRDINLLIAWLDQEYNIHLALGKAYAQSKQDPMAIEHLLSAYRVILKDWSRYQSLVWRATETSDPFSLRGLFFVPRVEVKGTLVDSRLVEIETILDRQYNLQPDDYNYDSDIW
mgnify:CR=1 FL=1